MRRRLAAGLVALFLPLLGVAGPAYADHGGRGDCSWEGDCGDGYGGGGYYDDGGGQGYDQWNNEDRNRNRNRNRGAFSPGPFDRSPIDFSGSCISLDCSGRDGGQKKKEGPGQQPAGFFPPNPAKIPGQIQAFLKLTFEFVQGVFSFAV